MSRTRERRMTTGPDRESYLTAPETWRLNQASTIVRDAFGAHPYLVGSCLTRPDYRDVDVRIMLDDERFAELFRVSADHAQNLSALWSLLCSGISEQMSRATGLPIDFQVQDMTRTNELYPGRRVPLALFSWRALETPA